MSVLRGCVTGNYIFITRFWELNKTNHQGTFWGMSSLKRIQSNLFFFFSLAYKESAAVIDWWVSATFFSLRTDMQHFGTKAFLQLSLLCEGWERGETVSVFFFFFFIFFFSLPAALTWLLSVAAYHHLNLSIHIRGAELWLLGLG